MTENRIYTAFSSRIIESITAAENIIIAGHSNPDGDCVFSQLACSEILSSLGKKTFLLNQGPFDRDEISAFAPLFHSQVPQDVIDTRPLVIVVDCSTIDRPGECIKPLEGLCMIVLDHHSSGRPFTDEDLMYIRAESVSTSLIVDALREELGVPLTKKTASYIYKGFATDTGFFHFISEKVAGETLRRVAALTDCGISPYEIYDEMHDGKKLEYFRFVSMLIQRTKSLCSGRLLYTFQKNDEETDGKPGDDIYAQLLQVEKVKVVLFFKEKDGCVEIGMRSKNKSGVDIGQYASTLGGGGHRYAAGARLEGSLEDIIEKVTREVSEISGMK